MWQNRLTWNGKKQAREAKRPGMSLATYGQVVLRVCPAVELRAVGSIASGRTGGSGGMGACGSNACRRGSAPARVPVRRRLKRTKPQVYRQGSAAPQHSNVYSRINVLHRPSG